MRTGAHQEPPSAALGSDPPRGSTAALFIVGGCDERLFGLTPAERLKRQFATAGVREIQSLDMADRREIVILVRADAVLDQPLIAILAKRNNLLLRGDGPSESSLAATVDGIDAPSAARLLDGGADPELVSRLLVRSPNDLDASFWKGLRKRETPYALRLERSNEPAVARRVFMGTYKGATDLVTKHLWPIPAYHVTRALAPLGITPNMVTTVAALLMAAAFWLFLEGWYLTGLLAAWLMTFLDTVDGKLARTTMTSSKWGDVFDHGIDLVHPPFWYAAWGLGLPAVGLGLKEDTLWIVLSVILGGYVLQRLMEGVAIKWLGLEIHIWREIDTLFRQVTARRNPNLLLLTASTLLGRPDLGLIAVAVWTAVCLVLHGIQLAQAFAEQRRSGTLLSWMESAASRP